MTRKRLTEQFPGLLPLRQVQRKLFFYGSMKMDGLKYASQITREDLPYCIVEDTVNIINPDSGWDIQYQYNKLENLIKAAETMNGLLLRKGEVYSFWKRVHQYRGAFKDGLVIRDGILETTQGGGLCQLSNFLFFLFLQSPMSVLERHAHRVQYFPLSEGGLAGMDATVSEGWQDLKVINDTEAFYQVQITFDGTTMTGRLRSNCKPKVKYKLMNRDKHQFRLSGELWEEVSVFRQCLEPVTGEVQAMEFHHRDRYRIGYPVGEEKKDAESVYSS